VSPLSDALMIDMRRDGVGCRRETLTSLGPLAAVKTACECTEPESASAEPRLSESSPSPALIEYNSPSGMIAAPGSIDEVCTSVNALLSNHPFTSFFVAATQSRGCPHGRSLGLVDVSPPTLVAGRLVGGVRTGSGGGGTGDSVGEASGGEGDDGVGGDDGGGGGGGDGVGGSASAFFVFGRA